MLRIHEKICSKNSIDFKSLYPKQSLRAADVTSTNTDFDKSTLVFGKVFVFTGALQLMLRKDAMQSVVDMGGICGDRITTKTNYLVLGNNDYCKSIKDGKSSKQKKAEKYKLDGFDIDIISKNIFYDMISE
jgi:DNA polymerase-3 subunit epsilon